MKRGDVGEEKAGSAGGGGWGVGVGEETSMPGRDRGLSLGVFSSRRSA